MGDYFTMARYYGQYVQAVTEMSRARRRVEDLRGAAAAGYGMTEEIAAAEEELRAAKEKADELWYLSNTGKPKPRVAADEVIPLSPFGRPVDPP